MKCKNCKNIYNLSNEDDEIVGKWCPKINDSPDVECDRECDKYKPMTNADRIRNMSDEELVDILLLDEYCSEIVTKRGKCLPFCSVCLLEWLQAEVKEGA